MFAVRIKSGRGRGGEFTDTICYMYIVSMIIPYVSCGICLYKCIYLLHNTVVLLSPLLHY